MKEFGIQMIPAYSPQARGRCERGFGTWQNRLRQELRLAGIQTLEGANRFLRDHYVAEFNRRLSKPAAEKVTAFRRRASKDLEEVFSIQTERTVAKDNTVPIGDRHWQLGSQSLPTCRTTRPISPHVSWMYGNPVQHLDGTVTVRWGAHVLGRFHAHSEPLERNCFQAPWKRRATAPTIPAVVSKRQRQTKAADAA